MRRIRNASRPTGSLRQQVSAEGRKRDVVFFAIVLLIACYIGLALFTGERAVQKYLSLEKNRKTLLTEIQRAERENAVLKREIEGLKKDPFYIEKHAREDYGLARPDELIFQFKEDGR